MSKAIRLSEDMIGNKVRCICKHSLYYYYPKAGTIGTIVEYNCQDKDISYKVQWPKGSTWGEDRWWVNNRYIELVEDNETSRQEIPNMTNEEIWEMLKPKMEKNGLVVEGYLEDYIGSTPAYDEFDVINAIAIAYRSGYERCMKGRPFKFGEKKEKGGHWEPVDPNNLPEEGTKVRYSRECKNYKNCENEIVIGDTGVVKLEGPKHDWFGIKLDNHRNLYYNWLSFDGIAASCLDMWVEDDE